MDQPPKQTLKWAVTLAALAVVVGLVTGVVVLTRQLTRPGGALRFARSPGQPPLSSTGRAMPPGTLPAARSDWVIFRGDQGLTGLAGGSLPDRLRLAWTCKTGGAITSSPVVSNGVVYVGSDDTNLYAIDLASGHKRWSFAAGGKVQAPPCVVDGTIYVGSLDHNLYAVDLSGRQLWKFPTGDGVVGSVNWVRLGEKLRILFGSWDHSLYCLDGHTGTQVWQLETDSYVNGCPAVDDGLAMFGGCDGSFRAVSVQDGQPVGQIDSGSAFGASPAVSFGRAFLGNVSGKFFCLDIGAGEPRWSYEIENQEFASSAALAGDRLVVGSKDKSVYCLDRDTSQKLWSFATGGEVNGSPVICGDKVVVASDDGFVYLLSLVDGRKVWSYELGKPVRSSPAVAGGFVIIGCDDGCVYAFTGD